MQLASFKKYTKIFALIFIVVIILAAVIGLGKGAQTMFSKASSCGGLAKVSTAQISGNSAVINWESSDINQGIVQYGTSSTNLNLPAPEGSPGKTHNVPLTLLTPNTVYYYLITIGNTKCDSSGQSCTDATCVPWSFTTAAITPQQQIVAPILTPTSPPASPSAAPIVSPSASISVSPLSAFCQQVKANLGEGNADATKWTILKQYDLDGNGFLNGMDVLKCQSSGK